MASLANAGWIYGNLDELKINYLDGITLASSFPASPRSDGTLSIAGIEVVEKQSCKLSIESLLRTSPFEDMLIDGRNESERLHNWLVLLTQPSGSCSSTLFLEPGYQSQMLIPASPTASWQPVTPPNPSVPNNKSHK